MAGTKRKAGAERKTGTKRKAGTGPAVPGAASERRGRRRMAIRLRESFEVEASADRAWDFLTDPVRVVPCIPSAELVRQQDERRFEADIGFGVGPFGARFLVAFRFEELDPERRSARMVGVADGDGTGVGGRMEMESRLEATPEGTTRVTVEQSVTMDGTLAAVAESALARNMAEMLFGRFVRCVQESLAR